MEALTQITTIEGLRTAMQTNPEDNTSQLDRIIEFFTQRFVHPNIVTIQTTIGDKVYICEFNIIRDGEGTITCEFRQMYPRVD